MDSVLFPTYLLDHLDLCLSTGTSCLVTILLCSPLLNTQRDRISDEQVTNADLFDLVLHLLLLELLAHQVFMLPDTEVEGGLFNSSFRYDCEFALFIRFVTGIQGVCGISERLRINSFHEALILIFIVLGQVLVNIFRVLVNPVKCICHAETSKQDG